MSAIFRLTTITNFLHRKSNQSSMTSRSQGISFYLFQGGKEVLIFCACRQKKSHSLNSILLFQGGRLSGKLLWCITDMSTTLLISVLLAFLYSLCISFSKNPYFPCDNNLMIYLQLLKPWDLPLFSVYLA